MKVNKETLELLKKHGFQWYKSQTTDRVEASGIEDVIPAANGFTVIYKDSPVFVSSTAKVESIEVPEDPDKLWIRVHWDTVEDERKV